MADDGNAASGAPGAVRRTRHKLTPEVRDRILSKVGEDAGKRAFARRFLDSQEQPQAEAVKPASGAEAPAQRDGQLLGLAKEAITKNPATLAHVGLGAGLTALLYQVYGTVLPKGIAAAGGAVSIALYWGHKAWRQFKAGWSELGSAVLLTNELVTTRIEQVAKAARSFSKTAFIALTALYLPSLAEAGRKLVEVSPSSDPWAPFLQLYQIAVNFLKAAPAVAIPALTYILAVAVSSFVSRYAKSLKPSNEAKKKELTEELKGHLAKEVESAKLAEPAEEPAAGTPVAGK